jgi:hypothetical protein
MSQQNLPNQLPSIRYLWTGTEEQLAALVSTLKKKQCIKRQKDIYDLFQNPNDKVKVRWAAHCKPLLAHLLFRLFAEGYCCIRGTKGYFSYAEKHFVGFDGQPFAKDSLKKMSSKVNNYPGRYEDVRREAEVILQNMTK